MVMQFDLPQIVGGGRGMWQDGDRPKKKESEPCLIPDGNLQRCSACGYPFPSDIHPSMSVAFADHLLKAHQLGSLSRPASPFR